MPFGLKNASCTYQKTMSKAFKDYLDDFTVFNDLHTHLSKIWRCFEKCQEYGISFNPKKCAFMVFSSIILRFIVSKEGKLPNLKKVEAIIKMPIPKNPHNIQVFNGLAQFYQFFVKNFAFIMAPITKLMSLLENVWLDHCVNHSFCSGTTIVGF
jgi:hypothetical protein